MGYERKDTAPSNSTEATVLLPTTTLTTCAEEGFFGTRVISFEERNRELQLEAVQRLNEYYLNDRLAGPGNELQIAYLTMPTPRNENESATTGGNTTVMDSQVSGASDFCAANVFNLLISRSCVI